MARNNEEEGRKDVIASHDGSDNIFTDLGLPDSEEYNAKADLALAIRRLLKEHGLTQRTAAMQAGVSQSDISNMVNGNLDGIGMERLTNVLNNLDQDVDIRVRPKRSARGRTSVCSEDASTIFPMAAAGYRG